MSQKAIVIGAGIVGLATARALTLKGYDVTVVERSEKAVGASIRNFGMIWPVGQPDGVLYQRALRSKDIWKEIADSIGLWYHENGSLHLAQQADEWQVLQELHAIFNASGRAVKLLTPGEIRDRYNGIKTQSILGGLYSDTEMIIDPRAAIAVVPYYLDEYLGVRFIWGQQVNAVEPGKVIMGSTILNADLICICSGADFETLYPEQFAAIEITRCKLQMMRFMPDTPDWRIGTSVCGGLSLIHYNAFKAAPSLPLLQKRYEEQMPAYLQKGIHVMVSQNDQGELTIGDSHEYGHTFDPFDQSAINELILSYLGGIMEIQNWKPIQSWNGIYPKMKNGDTELILQAEPGVYIVNGLGGAGMTLSFGLGEFFADHV